MKAKEDHRIGYMNCLKNYWDEMYPQVSYFTSKNLQDQASRIEKCKTALKMQNIEMNAVNTTDNNETQNVGEPTIKDIINPQQSTELPNEYVNNPVKESLATIFK